VHRAEGSHGFLKIMEIMLPPDAAAYRFPGTRARTSVRFGRK
jgi:hypothetical protein